MTDHEKRASERVPVALRIRLRYRAVEQFISKFAVNISRGGMFLSSRNPKSTGTRIYFEILMADDSPVIEGSGEVRWIREYDRTRPDEPHGMGIQFLELSESSWPLLDRILVHRRAIGELDDDAIRDPADGRRDWRVAVPVDRGMDPLPSRARLGTATFEPVPDDDDDDRLIDARLDALDADSLLPTRDDLPALDDDPPADPIAGPEADPPARRAHGQAQEPAEELAEEPAEEPAPEPARFADDKGAERPRAGNGARAPSADSPSDDALRQELMRALGPSVLLSRPEAPRGSRRPAGPTEPMVRAAMRRARALTSDVASDDQLDRELAELLEPSAVPVEITVEAASRELAERLGGAPVERRRAPRAPAADAEAARPTAPDESIADDAADPDEPDRRQRSAADRDSAAAADSHAARLLRGK